MVVGAFLFVYTFKPTTIELSSSSVSIISGGAKTRTGRGLGVRGGAGGMTIGRGLGPGGGGVGTSPETVGEAGGGLSAAPQPEFGYE